ALASHVVRSPGSTEMSCLSLHDALPIWLVGHHGVEVEVDHVAAANRVALDLADHGLDRRGTVDGDVDQHGLAADLVEQAADCRRDRKSTRLNSSHVKISYAVFCLKKKKY